MPLADRLDPSERAAVSLAIGRIFRLASRPEQPGDADEFHRCRALILDLTEGMVDLRDHRPNWARERRGGAAGD